jgi:hypothetical protein
MEMGIRITQIIQFNSILIYLLVNLTVHRPITMLARVRRNIQLQNTCKQNTKQYSLYSSSNSNN